MRIVTELLPHPSFSPGLVPSDFYVFGPMKEALRGIKFSGNEEVKK